MRDKYFIAFVIATLSALMIYSYTYHNEFYPSIYSLGKLPERQIGRLVELRGGEITRIDDTNNEFIYQLGTDSIRVKYHSEYSPRKTLLGKTYLLGIYRDGFIELIKIHNNDYNYMKYIVSVIGLVILLFYIVKEWRLKGLRLYPINLH